MPVHQAVDVTSGLCFVMFGFIPCLNCSLTIINSTSCIIFRWGVLFMPSVIRHVWILIFGSVHTHTHTVTVYTHSHPFMIKWKLCEAAIMRGQTEALGFHAAIQKNISKFCIIKQQCGGHGSPQQTKTSALLTFISCCSELRAECQVDF